MFRQMKESWLCVVAGGETGGCGGIIVLLITTLLKTKQQNNVSFLNKEHNQRIGQETTSNLSYLRSTNKIRIAEPLANRDPQGRTNILSVPFRFFYDLSHVSFSGFPMEVRQTVSREVARSVIMSPYTTYYTHSTDVWCAMVRPRCRSPPCQPAFSSTPTHDTRGRGQEMLRQCGDCLNGCWNLRCGWKLESINIIYTKENIYFSRSKSSSEFVFCEQTFNMADGTPSVSQGQARLVMERFLWEITKLSKNFPCLCVETKTMKRKSSQGYFHFLDVFQ